MLPLQKYDLPAPDSPANTVTLPSGTPLLKSPLMSKFNAYDPVEIQSVGSLNPALTPEMLLVKSLRNLLTSNDLAMFSPNKAK
jgi:hypothetical protein